MIDHLYAQHLWNTFEDCYGAAIASSAITLYSLGAFELYKGLRMAIKQHDAGDP